MVSAISPPSSGASTVKVDIVGDVSGLKSATQEARNEINSLGPATENLGNKMKGLDAVSNGLKSTLSAVAGGFGDLVSVAMDFAPALGMAGVAAVAAFAVAAKQGADESQRLSQALIMSGNAAGMSFSQVSEAAKAAAKETDSTQSKMAEIMTALVSTGKVAADTMNLAAEAAMYLEKAGVQASKKTVEQFAELGKEPTAASIKLNSQYHYLTASVLEQIDALEKQGNTIDAVTLAQRTFATEMSGRSKEIIDDLGSLERAWNAVSGAAKKAWDRMLDVGRKKSVADLIAETKGDIARGNTDAYGGEDGAKAALANLEARLVTENKIAEAKGKSAAQEEATERWLKEGEKYLTKREQKEREIAKAKADAVAAGKSEVDLATRLAAIEDKYAEKTPKARKSSSVDRDAAAVDQLRLEGRAADAGLAPQTIKELDALAAVQKKTNMGQEEYLRLAGIAMANDPVIAANTRAVTKELRGKAEATNYLSELERRYERSNQAKLDSFQVLPESVARLNSELRKVDEQADDARNKLARMLGDEKLSADDYAKQLEKLNDLTDKQKGKVVDLNVEQDRLNASWEVGAARAVAKYGDQARNVASASEQAFTRAFSSMEDALVQFSMTGKLNFSSLANSIISDIIRIQVRAAMSQGSSSSGGLSGIVGSFLSSGMDWLGAASGVTYGTNAFSQQSMMLAAQSFDGGGYTGSGSRTGGVDGKGGFYAIMHPDETVIDHTKGQSIAGGGSIAVNVNVKNEAAADGYQASASAQQNGNSIDVELIVQRVLTADLSRNGPLSQGMASTFGLRRSV